MALMMFIELVNPRPDSETDIILRFLGFFFPALISFIGFFMIRAKKLYPWESDK